MILFILIVVAIIFIAIRCGPRSRAEEDYDYLHRR